MSWEKNFNGEDIWIIDYENMKRNWEYSWRAYEESKKLSIERILWNGDKNATTVKWSDNTFTTVKLSPTDVPSSLLNAVSAAYVKKKYGSNSQFKKKIKDQFGFYNDSLYETISEIRFLDFVGSISKWNEIKEEKLYLLPSKGAGDVKRKKTSTR